jgi:PAS domain S-box-containing protein
MREKPIHVLLVEDEPAHAELVQRAFEASSRSFQFSVAESLAQARSYLDESQEPPSLIIADWLLPDGKGMDLLPSNPEQFRFPLVLMTSYGNEKVAVEAIKAGALDYVVKSEAVLADMPYIVERALRQWQNYLERQRAEDALYRSELRLRRITDNMLDVIIQVDASGKIEYISPSCQNVLGFLPEELVGRSFLERVEPQDKAMLAGILTAKSEILSRGQLEYRYRHARGHMVWLEAVGKVILNESGQIEEVILTNRDITERKYLEDQLNQARKLQAIGQLAGGIAHDFNNLLTVIISYCDILLNYPPEEPGLQRNEIEQIMEAGLHAASLTQHLLTFSRRQNLELQLLDLNEVISSTLKMLPRLIREDIELQTLLQRPLGNIKADPGQLEQVLINLAVNARDAMPQGGRLTIETGNIYLDENYSKRHLEVSPGWYIMLAVSDTGIGMDAQTQSHIFEPFFTTKEVGKGTGLGLATVHGIVKQSGGHIWIESEVGNGTSVKIYFPRVEVNEVETRSLPQSIPSASLKGNETILLIEDDLRVRQITREILQSQDYKVLEANGEDALQVSQQYPGKIDLLLTDIVMPKSNGREIAEQLLEVRPDLKVIYMSGYADDIIIQHGLLEGELTFLPKPFTPKTLVEKVRTTLDN